MDFELYGDDSKGVIKLDPRTKMVLVLASAASSVNMFNDHFLVAFNGVLCLLLFLCGRRATAAKAFALFALMFFVRQCIQGQGTGNVTIVSLCSMLITLFLFVFPVLISILLLVQTTRIGQFLAAFQAMHLPAMATIPVAVLFRFIPTVADERAGISKAMAFRGIEMTMGSVVRHPAQAVEHLLVPLLFSSVDVMEELAAASEARGLSTDTVRTSYEEVRLSPLDYVVMVAFSAMAIYMVVYSFTMVGA